MTENNTQTHPSARQRPPPHRRRNQGAADRKRHPRAPAPLLPRGLGELIPAMGIKFQELTAERTVATIARRR